MNSMRVRGNFTTERVGVNFVRSVVEGAGSFFKETNLLYDVGHDANVVLVVDNQVKSKEIALQIKSGRSYTKGGLCQFSASNTHLSYWANHDLQTLGVVYDPDERTAYWIDLKQEAKVHLDRHRSDGVTIVFQKLPWNRFDKDQFPTVLIPALLGQAPLISLETAREWFESEEMSTHDLGLRILRARHRKSPETWVSIIHAFKTRPLGALTADTPISIAALLGHDDLGFSDIPSEVQANGRATVLTFGPPEIAKALALVEDSDFERPSIGYSMMPLWGMSDKSPHILETISNDVQYDDIVRKRAAGLLGWCRSDPDWWGFWRRDRC